MRNRLLLLAFFCILFSLGYSQVLPKNNIQENQRNISIELPTDLKSVDITVKARHFKKVSAYTSMFLDEYGKLDSIPQYENEAAYSAFREKYSIITIKGEDYVGAFILLTNKIHISDLTNLGVKISGEPKNLVVGHIPVKLLTLLTELPYVLQIEIGTPVYKNDFVSRVQSRADSVIKGISLPQGYTGKGVIVGVIDGGFDFTHPNFYDSTGTKYRVKRVWNQNDSFGIRPAGFSYGSEYSTTTQILQHKTDDSNDTHGTHTTGIAGGSGYGYPDKLKGVSNEADIVLVATNLTNIGVIEAIEYLQKYAISQNKPLTINISLGSHYGPHDGTSFYDRYLDWLMNNANQKSTIISGSAGNSGYTNIHTELILNKNDSVKYTFIDPFQNSNFENIKIISYAAKNKIGALFIGLYDTITNTFDDYLPFINFSFKDSIGYSFQNVFLSAKNLGVIYNLLNSNKIPIDISYTPPDLISNKPNFKIEINANYAKMHNSFTNKYIVIGFKSLDNDIHSWIAEPGYSEINTSFSNLRYANSNIITGDNNITISEIGGTGKSTISVGAFNSYYNEKLSHYGNTNWGNISAFSSKGNTVDARIKPDISASGNAVLSSLNSWAALDKIPIEHNVTFKGRNYSYGWESGTSMAAPVLTGVMGLWLQACPLLSSNQAKYIIQQTAIKDIFTGVTPNSSYGYGKINAYGGIKLLLSLMPSKPTLTPNPKDTLICSKDSFSLRAPSGYAEYQWYNGSFLISNASAPSYTVVTPGSYFVAVKNSNGWWSNYSDTVNIRFDTIPVLPRITISAIQNSCTSNQNYLLTSTAGYSYQWYRNDTAIVNANTQTYSPLISGIYKVKTFSKNNVCSFLSDTTVITKITTNSNRLFNSDTIKICGSDSVKLFPITNYNRFLWSNGSINDTIVAKTTGLYKLTAYCGTNSSNYIYEQLSSSNNAVKYITIPDANQLDFTNEMSVLFKTRIDGPYSNSTLFEKGSNAYRLTLDATTSSFKFTYNNIDNIVGLKYTLTASQVQNAEWFYVGIVKTKDSSFFYVNGNIVDKAKTANPIPVNTSNLIVGTGQFPIAGRYNGSMDDISFWNRSLTQNEVVQYGRCMQGIEEGCVGYYNFEGTNAMLDRSIYGNNASQNGSVSNYPANQITSCTPTQIRDSVFVSIINPSLSPQIDTICINTPVQISSKIQASPVKRLWSTGDTTVSIVVKPKTDLTYRVTLSDNYQSCQDSATISVSAPATTINLIGKTVFCQGDSAILYAPVMNSGFQWLRNNIPINGAIKNMFTALTSGSYRVICFNNSGCSDTSTAITIRVNQNPVATVSPAGPVSVCAGDSILLNASAGVFYQWYQNGSALSAYGQTYYASASGKYSVVLIDSNGCSATSNLVTAVITPLPVVTIQQPSQNYLCDGSTLILRTSGKNKYQWLNNNAIISGAIDSIYTVYVGGIYSVYAIDSNGCRAGSTNQIPITLIKKVKPDFSISSRCISTQIPIKNLTDTTNSGLLQWNWNLGGNTTSILFEPTLSVITPQSLSLGVKVSPVNCPALADSISRTYTFEKAPDAIQYPPVDARKQVAVRLIARNFGTAYQWMPVTGLDTTTIASPLATLNRDQVYMIKITTTAGCIVTDTVKVRVVTNYGVYVPSGFSPDRDGVNDLLRPICVGIKELHYFKVLNRWGQLLFETSKMNTGWDGNYNGKPQPSDTYIWVVEALDIDGNLIRINGKSTLIR